MPVVTAQKRQARVQMLPRIMNVAVRRTAQHSWMFGHFASSQTVCRFFSRIIFLRPVYVSFVFSLIFNHSGFRFSSPRAKMISPFLKVNP